MSAHRSPSRLAALAAVALALVLSGCGDSGPKAESTTTTATSTTAADALSAPRIAEAEAAVKAKPASTQALADLAEAHYLAAGTNLDPADNSYRPAGREHLRLAARAWERLLALKPKRPDIAVASMMSLAYGKTGLGEPRKAIAAQLIVAEVRKDSASYQALAIMAYEGGDKRTGDRAAERAVKLAPAADRKRIGDGLRALRAGKFPQAS